MEWWHPDELKKSEYRVRQIDDISLLDNRNDFGSYRLLRLKSNTADTAIECHNDVKPLNKIRWISKVLNIIPTKITSILDAGCGVGFTTGALAECFYNARVTGIDISEDAIGYANEKFPKADFRAQAISPGPDRLGQFDIIFCFEFYPFTRNSDPIVQSRFIQYFADQLSDGGKIVIFQKWENSLSMSIILNQVAQLCPGLVFEIHSIPHPRLPSWLPISIAQFGSKLINFTGRPGMKRFIMVKKVYGSVGT